MLHLCHLRLSATINQILVTPQYLLKLLHLLSENERLSYLKKKIVAHLDGIPQTCQKHQARRRMMVLLITYDFGKKATPIDIMNKSSMSIPRTRSCGMK